jgi:hypothetical protein
MRLVLFLEMSENITMHLAVEKTLLSLIAFHGHSAMFVCELSGGVSLYTVGGVHYSIRDDGTARAIYPAEVSPTGPAPNPADIALVMRRAFDDVKW